MTQGRAQRGFTFLELIAVVIIIAILASSGLVYYERALKDSRRTGVEILAHRFTTAVALVHGQWILQGGRAQHRGGAAVLVDVDGVGVYVNEAGWPASTEGGSVGIGDQTAEECHQVWQAVLQNPALATVERSADDGDGRQAKRNQRYHVSQVDRRTCRYELVTEPAGTHYFDYHVQTGQVVTTVPPFD